jgi:tRNA dimethylallyltransferase
VIQVIAVVGPTGSGKTALGIEIAQALDTEVISADSMQFYRGMEIGTGAPNAEELSAVSHHFIGHLSPNQEMSAGDYEIEACAVVKRLNDSGKPAVVVGGSGLYIRTLVDGLFDGPSKDQAIRDRLEAEAEHDGIATLYARLKKVDPEYAKIISKNDLRRIVRALELFEIAGEPASVQYARHQASLDGFSSLQFLIDFPRKKLYDRINRRVDMMLDMGLVDEVKALVEQGYAADIMRLKSLGYREILSYVQGERPYDEAVELMKMYTRRYAKRQLTWFRGDERVNFMSTTEHPDNTSRLEHVLEVHRAKG